MLKSTATIPKSLYIGIIQIQKSNAYIRGFPDIGRITAQKSTAYLGNIRIVAG